MSKHEAFNGVTVHHLYRDCPSLRMLLDAQVQRRYKELGRRMEQLVDPMSADVCDLCQRVWIRETTETTEATR